MAHHDAPLNGIRVLDCSRVLAGPFATMLLADLGADVVKLEAPEGDESRGWGPPWWGPPEERRSAYFASVNRNKRSIVVDLKSDAGRVLLDRLAARADLLVDNALPSSGERLGLATDRLAATHPQLVVAAVGGFPGADAERPAYDLLAQAMGGLMTITGEPDGPPTKVGVAVLDLLAGLELAVGALAALVGRRRVTGDGSGGRVEVSLIEASVTALINVLGNHLASGEEPRRWGNEHPNIVPYQAFAARDGHLVVAVGNDAQFGRLLGVLGLAPDERFATNPGRVAGRRELVPRLADAIAARDRDEVLAALREADVPSGPVRLVSEALAAMQVAHDGAWTQEVEGIRLTPNPIRVDGERLPLRLAPPQLGEHTDEVLAEAGLSSEEIAALRAGRVIG
ncbi:MAG TPA: CoA transferase [Candidatus Dormibacteraeota bacterium]|nr:CoA transferase [Candidatus Dormibacteraeota bacterium]